MWYNKGIAGGKGVDKQEIICYTVIAIRNLTRRRTCAILGEDDMCRNLMGLTPETVNEDAFVHALQEDEKLALKWLLYLRDIQEGEGKRGAFRELVNVLAGYDEDMAIRFLDGIGIEQYGRWDDYIEIAYTVSSSRVRKAILKKVDRQLAQDMLGMDRGKDVSLLAKWLPSENASSQWTKEKAEMVCDYLMMSRRDYRKILSELRAYIGVVEREMSDRKWDRIEYEEVPSKANATYRNAFLRHDRARRERYLASHRNIHAGFPHEIIHAYKGVLHDEELEKMWKAQTKCEGYRNTLVVQDGRTSMNSFVGRSGIMAKEVADAITLYCAENNTRACRNKFIACGSPSRLCSIEGLETLRDKLYYLYRKVAYANMDIYEISQMIRYNAMDNHLSQEDLPAHVLIVSDIMFDENRNGKGLLDRIREDYAWCGYKPPKLIYWDVSAGTHLTENRNGVILMSGFSRNMMQVAMSSETDPYKALIKKLGSDRYSIVDRI